MQIKDLIPWGRDKDDAPKTSEDGKNALVTMQRDINRMFDDFWSRVEQPFANGKGWLGVFGPSTDVAEAGEEVEVSIELPGMDEKDIDVSISGDTLSIRGEKKAEREEKKSGYYLSERSYGAFYRTVPLPPGVDGDKASAEFKRGVLTIRLPKTPEAQSRIKKIDVKAA